MKVSVTDELSKLYKSWSGKEPSFIEKLPSSGSYRSYFRMRGPGGNVVGAFNEDLRENGAFISFTRHFRSSGLPVPQILAEGEHGKSYLLTDLGDMTLFDFLSANRNGDHFTEEVKIFYKKVLHWLPEFQVNASQDLDYSKCYPRASFDRQSMHWDLNYFKYYFLKLAKIPFDEQKLEDDFNALIAFLLEADHDYFLYRDFQSRNIMIQNNNVFFIDYQGGRKGALQYDVASLLFDGKAALPPAMREELLEYYLDTLALKVSFDRPTFLSHYNGFVLIRIFQALGAYGFRGYYENKPHFLQSIPFAAANLEYITKNDFIPQGLPVLRSVINRIIENPELRHFSNTGGRLKVTIRSFAYKRGIPADQSGHGGGFVFDCRALPNPGRFPEYATVNGTDKEVIDYMHKENSVDEFLNHVYAISDLSVREYLQRDFTNLEINFGCTGGQHRSVYCAERLAMHLKEKFNVSIELEHTEKDHWLK